MSQSCVLAPALLRTAIDWIVPIGANKAGVNVGQSPFTDTDYANDAVLLAEDDAQWTSILEWFDTAANAMGLHTSWAKTTIQNVASGPSPPFCVISGHQVEAVNRFTYLGRVVDSSGYCAPEILRRIGLASSIMSQLDHVWRQSRLSNTTKLRIYNYNSCVLSSLLYASETWTLLTADIAKLEAFHMANQRRILGILWYEFITNEEVATLSQLPSINKAPWLIQPYGSGCSRPPSHTSLSHVTRGLGTVWHPEETTRSSAKKLGEAGHHEHRALLLMLGVLRQIGQHGGLKRRERMSQCFNVFAFV